MSNILEVLFYGFDTFIKVQNDKICQTKKSNSNNPQKKKKKKKHEQNSIKNRVLNIFLGGVKTFISFFSFRFVTFEFNILASSTNVTYNGRSFHVTMIPNPSHLEASHPVISGKTRSRLLTKNAGHYNSDIQSINKVLSVHVHGDAAISGQVLTKFMQEFHCFKSIAMFWQENYRFQLRIRSNERLRLNPFVLNICLTFI